MQCLSDHMTLLEICKSVTISDGHNIRTFDSSIGLLVVCKNDHIPCHNIRLSQISDYHCNKNVDMSLQKRAKSPSPSRKPHHAPSEPPIDDPLIAEKKSEANEQITETPRAAEKAEKEEVVAEEISASVAADPSFTSVFDIEPPFKECLISTQYNFTPRNCHLPVEAGYKAVFCPRGNLLLRANWDFEMATL